MYELADAFIDPTVMKRRYREPHLIVRRRWLFVVRPVAGTTVVYEHDWDNKQLHISLSGDVYEGRAGYAKLVNPRTRPLKELRRIIERLHIEAVRSKVIDHPIDIPSIR